MARGDVRARVLSAARAVFSRRGYKATRVADIIDEAGVARATFYKYFTNKRQVFLEIIRDFLKALYENTSDYMLEKQDDPGVLAERIRQSLVLFYRLFLENREIVRVYFREAFGLDPGMYAVWDNFDRQLISLFARVLDNGVEQGIFRPMDTGLVARALFMVFLQVPYRDIMVGGRTDLDVESIAEEMVTFAMNGITA